MSSCVFVCLYCVYLRIRDALNYLIDHFFPKVLPEWVPTLDNLEFGQAVQQLDKVLCV